MGIFRPTIILRFRWFIAADDGEYKHSHAPFDWQDSVGLDVSSRKRSTIVREKVRSFSAAAPAISLMKRSNCGKALDIARLARYAWRQYILDDFHVMRVLAKLETGENLEGTHDLYALILRLGADRVQAFN